MGGTISMNKMFVGILSLLLIVTALSSTYVLNIKSDNKLPSITSKTDYRQIKKTFTGFIFSSEGKLVKEISVKINGKQSSVHI